MSPRYVKKPLDATVSGGFAFEDTPLSIFNYYRLLCCAI